MRSSTSTHKYTYMSVGSVSISAMEGAGGNQGRQRDGRPGGSEVVLERLLVRWCSHKGFGFVEEKLDPSAKRHPERFFLHVSNITNEDDRRRAENDGIPKDTFAIFSPAKNKLAGKVLFDALDAQLLRGHEGPDARGRRQVSTQSQDDEVSASALPRPQAQHTDRVPQDRQKNEEHRGSPASSS